MKKWIVMIIVFGLVCIGCTRPEEQNIPEKAEQEALEATKEAVPQEAAKPAAEDPDVKNCLQLVGEEKYDGALPVCLEALKKNPANDQVKAAVEKAKAATADIGAAATEAVQDAQKATEEKAQDVVNEVTGGLAP